MKNFYFAIISKCNQSCTGCPCGKHAFDGTLLSLDDIKETLQDEIGNEELAVTLSGGEPLLHPQIFDILDYLNQHKIYVTILTNGEKLSDVIFLRELINHLDKETNLIITTIHDAKDAVHEAQNHSKGSFHKSILGLLALRYYGINIHIKHCITKKNYISTKDFFALMSDLFDPGVTFELWNIDYCGLSLEEAKDLYVSREELQPYLEEALDFYISTQDRYHRELQIKNIPLCFVDPYYWPLFPLGQKLAPYNSYQDSKSKNDYSGENYGKLSKHCKECDVYPLCLGAYKTLFTYFGDDVVSPIKKSD